MQKSTKTYTVKEATVFLERYCVYQERCHQEVIKKADSINLIPIAKEEIIVHLLQHDFLNEARFAKAYARGKFTIKKWGKIKITQHLKAKKISNYCIKLGLQEIDNLAYEKTLEVIALKKTPLIKAKTSYEKKVKLTRFLYGRGFEYDLIRVVVAKIVD